MESKDEIKVWDRGGNIHYCKVVDRFRVEGEEHSWVDFIHFNADYGEAPCQDVAAFEFADGEVITTSDWQTVQPKTYEEARELVQEGIGPEWMLLTPLGFVDCVWPDGDACPHTMPF